MPKSTEISSLLERARHGDDDAKNELVPLVYRELRSIAGSMMRTRRPGHTLQPTALVNEAYLRVLGGEVDFANRAHFFFVAARAMQDILVEHARASARLKRGGDKTFVSTEALTMPFDAPPEEMLALSEALNQLEASHPRPHQLVLLRFFAGLTSKEAAELMEMTERTAARDWRFAKAFLHSLLTAGEDR